MAGGKSAYLEKKLLDFMLGGGSYTPPGTVYIALSTSAFAASATGSSMNEVSGGAYARQSLTNNSTNWPAATGSDPASKSNGTSIAFPQATADWGTVKSVYIVDAASDGNILYGGDLAAPVAMTQGSTLSLPSEQLIVQST